eukprot:UN01334
MSASVGFKKLSEMWWKKIEPIGPFRLQGSVVKGHQRGREIGCKTANLDPSAFPNQLNELVKAKLNQGVYVGFGRVDNGNIYKNVLSIGTNPHFGNENITVESHLLHTFENDFYASQLRVIITGFIRPQLAFNSLDDLIKAINTDISFGDECLDKEPHSNYINDYFITKEIELDT